MPMHALATIPLIKKLGRNYKQVWFANDAAAVGTIVDWWDRISTSGPGFGCFSKCFQDLASHQGGTPRSSYFHFANTGVNVTPSGRPYLGAAIGFWEYVAGKVESKGQRVDIYHTMSCNYSRNPTPCCLLCPNT